MHQIGIGHRKEREKKKVSVSDWHFPYCPCKSNRKKKKKYQNFKDINLYTRGVSLQQYKNVQLINSSSFIMNLHAYWPCCEC